MKKQMQIFSNPAFGNVRTIEEDGKVLFCAKDIAKGLGYMDTINAIKSHCKGVVKRHLPTDSGIQELNVIPEGDVYRLIVRSKLPAAEKFEHWVFDEVVPSVVSKGGYGQTTIDVETITKIATVVCSEMIKHISPFIKDNQFEDEIMEVRSKRRNSHQWSIIGRLDTDLKEEAESLISSGRFTSAEIKKTFEEQHGVLLSISSICRYRNAMREHGLMEDRIF